MRFSVHLLSPTNCFLCIILEEDIDGQTLALLQQSDICEIFPRIKDRVKFIDYRTKLISSSKDQNLIINTIATNTSNSVLSTIQSGNEIQENADLNSSSSITNITNGVAQENDLNSTSNPQPLVDNEMNVKPRLSTYYEGPQLTDRMKQYIEQYNWSKFNAHTKMRSELLSMLYDDVTKTYNLL